MQACREEMTHLPNHITNQDCVYRVVELNEQLAGFYKLVDIRATKIHLDALFVEPSCIGEGLGRILIEHAKSWAKQRNAQCLITQSDPFAEEFYASMGGVVVGRLESGSVAGRFLPLMEIDLC